MGADIVPPWAEIPDSATVPGGLYEAIIEDLDPDQLTSTGKLSVNGQFRLTGGDYDNQVVFEQFTLGSKTDPMSTQAITFKTTMGWINLNKCLDKAGAPKQGSLRQRCAAATKSHVIIDVTQVVEPAVDKQGQPNPYAGRVKNRIRQYYAIGERPLAAGPVAAAPGASTWQKPEMAQPVPVSTAGNGPTEAAPTVQQVQSVQTAKCGICGNVVARSGFAKHVEQHAALGQIDSQ